MFFSVCVGLYIKYEDMIDSLSLIRPFPIYQLILTGSSSYVFVKGWLHVAIFADP